MTSPKTQTHYDVIVVGSGAAGGMAVHRLCKAGAKVCMLEAGRDYDPLTETPMFQLPRNAPLRAVRTPDKPAGFYSAVVGGNYRTPGEPYQGGPGTKANFWWFRPRMLGGCTNHWGRIALRFGPYDFKGRSRDGLGFDWPIEYEDLAPYYDKVERLIGVFGSREGLENTPDSPPEILQPPPPARGYELYVKKIAAGRGIPVVPIHRAVLTRPLGNRAPCFYATSCRRGCLIGAAFQTTIALIPPALATGNLEIRTHAMVREVTLGKDGRATGVLYVDKKTGETRQVHGRAVMLGASAFESGRILLNSRSSLFPDGLANSSGLVGKYIMDSPGTEVVGQIPRMENVPPHNEEGVWNGHMYMPWWGHQAETRGELDFPRGYHVEFSGGRMTPDVYTATDLEGYTGGSYGLQFKKDARRYYGSFLSLRPEGEMIANEDCWYEIDPGGTEDAWGIPVLKFHWRWGDHERRQARHMAETMEGLIADMGGTVHEKKTLVAAGKLIHNTGGLRMGADKNSSVTNPFCQTWDVENLFVTDASVFPSLPHKNPALTIMAVAWRTCDHLLEAMKRREV
jgi:choline dehydrogenase-like flavoprotein